MILIEFNNTIQERYNTPRFAFTTGNIEDMYTKGLLSLLYSDGCPIIPINIISTADAIFGLNSSGSVIYVKCRYEKKQYNTEEDILAVMLSASPLSSIRFL